MHLCFSITSHGFGHGAISTAIIERIMGHFPTIQITVMTLLPKSYLDSRLSGAYTHIEVGHDFGMLMDSPIEVDVIKSRDKYQHLFAHWQDAVTQEKTILQAIKPDCVISNISPITLDVAMQLRIPTASVAPFNWAQIYKCYCLEPDNEETHSIYKLMLTIYKNVDYIYKPLPSVPFDGAKEISIASINNHPQEQVTKLLQYLPEGTEKIAMVALGGFPISLDLQRWPQVSGLHWLVDQPNSALRDDMTQIKQIGLSFLELVGSCDLIITKPGYGTYCEIADIAKLKKIRAISLARSDWPETPFLNQFLASRVPFVEIDIESLEGGLAKAIERVNKLEYPRKQACEDGALQLINHLVAQLSVTSKP